MRAGVLDGGAVWLSESRARGIRPTFLLRGQQSDVILAGHRWDSASLSLLSVALCVEGAFTGRRALWVAGGGLIAIATFCTLTIGVLALTTCSVLVVKPRRRFLWSYLCGFTAMVAVLLLVLTARGLLGGFLTQVLWLSQNYSGVNVTSYGWVNGGWRELSASEFAASPAHARVRRVTGIVANRGDAARAAARLMKRVDDTARCAYDVVALGVLGYVVSTLPRPDIGHLTIVAPLGYILATVVIAKYLRAGAALAVFVALFPFAIVSVADCRVLARRNGVFLPVGNVQYP